MTMHPQSKWNIPHQTQAVARAVFPQGNIYLTIADHLGQLYEDEQWKTLYNSHCGQNAISPARLALVTIFQFMEGLTDRQAAEAVRARIDWKYVLALELTDQGFDFSVLSDWRKRLIENKQTEQLLEIMLSHFNSLNLLTQRSKQRTDSTHVLGAIRQLNRLECVGEALRKVLNDLAILAPDWLKMQVNQDWFDLYGVRFEKYRFPKEKSEKEKLAIRIGEDGYYLLTQLELPQTPLWLKQIASVEILRQIWLQQYYLQEEQVQWRETKNLGMPPNKILIQSPFDIEARNRTKRELNWTGYTVHLTETCEQQSANLITNVETTPATTDDGQMTAIIHQHLAQKQLLPNQHFVDTSYGSAHNFLSTAQDYQVELIAPVASNQSWQANSEDGFPLSSFSLNWETKQAICPMGQTSISWKQRQDKTARGAFEIRFSPKICLACECRHRCTRSKKNPRILKIRPQEEFEVLQQLRQKSQTSEYKKQYQQRAGIEGTISQGIRSFSLRSSRYIGLKKTHLQNIAIACGINLTRVVSWLKGRKKELTRTSSFAGLEQSYVA